MPKLAINGGNKAVTLEQNEALRWPPFGEEEKKRVLEVIDLGSGEAGKGWYTEAYRFEDEFAQYLSVKHALAHTNGTAAIHAALFAVGVAPGDEVITPSYTYWASCMPIICCNAIPVFAEVDPKTCTIDPEDIERRITSRTKAILAVHIWGMPCEMDKIMKLARKHSLKVIEDAAQAHGAEYRGKKVGTIGDIGCFSFQASKNLPAIEGGMLVTNERDYYERAIALGHYERVLDLPASSSYRKYAGTCFGYKYRMHPLSAALGRVQLKHLDERNQRRNANIEYIDLKLKELPGLAVFETPDYIKRIYYQHEVILECEELGVDRDKFIQALQAEGAIVQGERYPLQHQQPAYQTSNIYGKDCPWNSSDNKKEAEYKSDTLPVSLELRNKIISLPTFPEADVELLDQYVYAFRKVIENVEEIKV